MPDLTYHLLDVFTDQPFGGNQLAVFPEAVGLPTDLMGRIAREMALSETVFVVPPTSGGDVRLRIFTPEVEMPMAGHPTVGTGYLLHRLGTFGERSDVYRVIFEEGVGPLEITIDAADPDSPVVWMAQPAPSFVAEFPDREVIAAMLSLSVDDLRDLPLQVVSTGVPFLMVPVNTLGAMGRINLRLDLWQRHLKDFAASQMMIFTTETEVPGCTVHARMFGPAFGIAEDAATGSASGPMGAYLVRHRLAGPTDRIISEQGIEMGRPSRIEIAVAVAEDGTMTAAHVGGKSVYMGRGTLRI